jgi:hypothetical protein
VRLGPVNALLAHLVKLGKLEVQQVGNEARRSRTLVPPASYCFVFWEGGVIASVFLTNRLVRESAIIEDVADDGVGRRVAAQKEAATAT